MKLCKHLRTVLTKFAFLIRIFSLRSEALSQEMIRRDEICSSQLGRVGEALASSPPPTLTRATMASRPETAVSTVLDGGAGLFVTEASSSLALRDLQREEEMRDELTPSPTSVPLPRLPVATSPSLYPPLNNPLNQPPSSPTSNQFSKFWQTSPRRRESTSSPGRRGVGSVWRDRRDQRAESEIIARQRTYEQRENRIGSKMGSRMGRGR